jgi:hypothetical protein
VLRVAPRVGVLLAALLGVVLLLVVLLGVDLRGVALLRVVLRVVAPLVVLTVQPVVPRAAVLPLMVLVLPLGMVESRTGAILVLPRLIGPGSLLRVLRRFLFEWRRKRSGFA